MKIDETLISQAVEKSDQSSGQAKGLKSDDAFASLLQGEVESAGKTGDQDGGVCDTASLAGLWSLQAPSVQGAGKTSQTSSEAVSSLNTVLDGLDSLQNALQGTKSPKEINSLIEQINQQAAGLDTQMSGLPDDSPLRGLAEETKVTAYMESMKWKRGDYL